MKSSSQVTLKTTSGPIPSWQGAMSVQTSVSILSFQSVPRKSGPTDFPSDSHVGKRKCLVPTVMQLSTNTHSPLTELLILQPTEQKKGEGRICDFATGEDSALAMLNCTLPCAWYHYKLRSHLLQVHKQASCMYKSSCT